MPTTAVPDELRDLFEEPALAHASYLNGSGQIVIWPMWVDFDGDHARTLHNDVLAAQGPA